MMIDLNILKSVKGPIKIVGHKKADFDSMTSGYLLEYVLKQLGMSARFVLLDDEIDIFFEEIAKKIDFNCCVWFGLKDNDNIFLVDHTDSYEQNVVGCFDHHPPIVNIDVNYVNQKKTSCAKLIYEWAESLGVEIPEKLTILTVYACYMDSLSFKSTKAVLEDKVWCQEQMKKLGLKEREVEKFGFGLTPRNTNLEDFLTVGTKTYSFGDKFIKSSYAVVDNNDDVLEDYGEFFRNQLSDNVIAWCYIQHNVLRELTRIYLVTKEYALTQTIEGLLSRGNNIIPKLMEFLSFENDGKLTKKLIEKNLQVATMESCTSGLIASNITDYEGASVILKGSSITYSNEAKIMAGVPESTIRDYGVYSEETSKQMAYATKNNFDSNIGIGITGSFGNVDPVNKDSIAGVVYYTICQNASNAVNFNTIKLIYNNLNASRKEMKQKTVDIVLATLCSMI